MNTRGKLALAVLAVLAIGPAIAFAHADNKVCVPYYGTGNQACHDLDTNVYSMCGPTIPGGCVEVPKSDFGVFGAPGLP
jgi:hypothetical protein